MTSSSLTASEFEALARNLMAEHLDPGWTFGWNDAVNQLGFCNYETRRLTFSRHAFADGVTRTAAHNTITHEVAHAMVGPKHGHGPVWRRQHVALGGDGNRHVGGGGSFSPALAQANRDKRRFLSRCPACGKEERRTRRGYVSCGRCSGGKFQEKFRLEWFRVEDDGSLTPRPMRRRAVSA